MANVPQRLDLGLGKADPDEYFRRLALYSYAVAPLFPGRKQEGQYVPGLRQYAAGGRILEDEFPSAYMPGVGRQVMAGGGRPIQKALELARSIITDAPEKTVNAYKLFRQKDDQLYPLFVNANTPVPMGEWLAAQSGPMVGEKVKSSLGPLAYRPGWHAGDLPIATHIGGKSSPGLNAPDYRPANQVWAEIAMPDDVDWQTEALRRAQLNKRGEIIPRTAHITDQVPVGGYYRYKTNPNMTGDWMIGGSMRVNRILPDEEVMEINRARGVSDLPRIEDILKRQGMQVGGTPSFEGEVSFAPADMQADAARIEQENRASSEAARQQARQAYSVSPVVDMGINRALRFAERENAPRAMPTAHEFVQRELGRGEPQLPQYDREAVERMKAGAEGVAHMAAYGIPVVGEVLGAYDMANALRNVASPEFRKAAASGDYAAMAGGLADVGLSAFGIPGKAAKAAAAAGALLLPDDAHSAIFGEAARMSPQIRSALEAAKRAIVGGAKPAETWQKYGWAPDPSGKMVSELSDASARLIPEGLEKFRRGEQMTLGEILSHPEYYDLYPSMYSTRLNPVTPNDERVRGYYNQITDQLHASTHLDERALLGNLLHEPTHRMQIIEEMSPGTDPRIFANPFVHSQMDREDLSSIYGAETVRNFMAENPGMKALEAISILRDKKVPIGPQPMKFITLAPEAAEETKNILRSKIENTFRTMPDPNYQYKMSLGEVAARLPGERIEMPEAARRAAFPFADENIIVRPPSTTKLRNVSDPEWERNREQALEIARQLQQSPLPPVIPSKYDIEVTDAEEELMRIAQQLEAQKRAGKAFVSGKAGGGGVKSALKMLGKLFPEGSGYAGVPGKPSLVNLPGIGKVEARPIPEIESAASKYMQTIGRPGEHEISSFPEFNPEFATKVADAFAEMKHRPGDPAVRRAYDALIDETMAQYRAAKDTGIDFRFLKEGQADPYAASPALGYEDIVNRGRLFVFPTEQGFGSSGGLIADNPLLRRAGKVGDKPDAVVNDAFRIVHDLYGHFGPGNPFFRAPGEERAYQLHSRMFGPEALPAATLETRGQNSWLNYGPYGEANRSALGADTHFAEQKIGRMPEWTQAPAPAVGSDVEEYIRSLTGKAEGGEVEREGYDKGGASSLVKAALKIPAVKKAVSELFPGASSRYAAVGDPVLAFDPKTGKEYLEKTLTPEAELVSKARKAAQAAIKKGDYQPYFNPAERFDVRASEYDPYISTLDVLRARPETIEKYETHARTPEAVAGLTGAYEQGMKQASDAGDWYLMGQLENEFLKHYGPSKGREMFKERFADAMAATTGGADPTTNLMMAHYGNYLKNAGLSVPENAYEYPFPIGGRFARTNMDQYRKMIMEGRGIPPTENPKRYNFAYNFLGEPRGSTIDEQMSGLFDPKMTMPTPGTYGHYEGALADLARAHGVSPRYFQEVAWAGAKDLSQLARGKPGYKAQPMIQNVNEAIERTSRITGLPPEQVVERGLVKSEMPLYAGGGSVIDDALRVSSDIASARELEAV